MYLRTQQHPTLVCRFLFCLPFPKKVNLWIAWYLLRLEKEIITSALAHWIMMVWLVLQLKIFQTHSTICPITCGAKTKRVPITKF